MAVLTEHLFFLSKNISLRSLRKGGCSSKKKKKSLAGLVMGNATECLLHKSDFVLNNLELGIAIELLVEQGEELFLRSEVPVTDE